MSEISAGALQESLEAQIERLSFQRSELQEQLQVERSRAIKAEDEVKRVRAAFSLGKFLLDDAIWSSGAYQAISEQFIDAITKKEDDAEDIPIMRLRELLDCFDGDFFLSPHNEYATIQLLNEVEDLYLKLNDAMGAFVSYRADRAALSLARGDQP